MTLEPHSSTPHDGALRLAAQENQIAWAKLEDLMHVDPAGRGLASFRHNRRALDAGQLQRAAVSLAERASAVGIVTGFAIVLGDRVSAETDGPPGALYLARALVALGVEVTLITDRYALPLLEVGCDLWNLDRRMIVEFPLEEAGGAGSVAKASPPSERWVDNFFATRGRQLSHLVAIERAGPSHTLASLEVQARHGPAPSARFAAEVPAHDRDVCHNMRGRSIDRHTGKTHLLFERIAERRLPITTIGIGDGGNELGMGSFPWEMIVQAIGGNSAGRLVCRTATDLALVAGVSNWAAYALALAVARLRGADEAAQGWTAEVQRRLIEAMVERTSAVDGVTLRKEATVDGLPLGVYLETLAALRRQLGYGDAAPPASGQLS